MAELEQILRAKLQQKPILLMTHLVLGYPSFATNRQVIAGMAANGVELIELQIPFSEPVADGPMIVKANQDALARGVRVADCLDFAAEMVAAHPEVSFLFMTYCNILFRYGLQGFVERARQMGLKGFIIPDLPPEEGMEYVSAARDNGMAPIQIFAPTSRPERMKQLANHGEGFVYCVARRGVTGSKTDFDADFDAYLKRCRAATDLPLAVGFGIRSRDDVSALTGRADIAIIGTEILRLVDEKGPEAVGPFIAGLRQ